MTSRNLSLRLLLRLQAEFDRLFREALHAGCGDAGSDPVDPWEPPMDIVETAGAVRILIEVPGLTADDLTVEVRGDRVEVRGDQRAAVPAGDGHRFQCVERRRGAFRREIRLDWPVNSHQGRAQLADGMLVIELPKIDDQRDAPRRLVVAEDPAAAPAAREVPET
jgi:HSP20 family protein